MIRRKVSTGLLRAAKSTTTSSASASAGTANAVSASPMQQQSASLASAVLLSSQRNWKGETVATLKGELKKRGLSQSGNKSTLVSRLSSAETSQHLPPMPSLRTISTTSPKSAKKSDSDSKSAPSKEEDTATMNTTKEMTTGPEISSKSVEAEAFEEPTKEQLNVAPGLPESGKVAPSSGEKLSIKMPGQEAENETDQVIPLVPDNFRAKVENQLPKEQDLEDVPEKVMTVASASTHLSGGPVSAIHESSDSASLDTNESTEKGQGQGQGFPGAGESLASALNSVTSMSKTAGEFSRSFIPEIGFPKATGGKKGGEYKAPKQGLDDDEKRGLWVLGGIVGLGLLIGGPKKDKESKIKSSLSDVAGKLGGEKGVKGDEEWAKASGAGVVGHGARKD